MPPPFMQLAAGELFIARWGNDWSRVVWELGAPLLSVCSLRTCDAWKAAAEAILTDPLTI